MATITYYTGENGLVANSVSFDATMGEDHSGDAVVTDHEVERGADITDHVKPSRARLTLNVIISNTPIEDSGRLVGTWIPTAMPVPPWVAKDVQPRRARDPVISPGFVSPFLGRGLGPFAIPRIRTDTKVTPGQLGLSFGSLVATVYTFPNPRDRLKDLWSTLSTLRLAGETLFVSTRLEDYDNMVIDRLSTAVEARDALTFSISFKQIGYAESLTFTTVEKVKVATDAKKALPKVDQGPKDTYEITEEQKRSDVIRLARLATGYRSPDEVLADH